MSNLTTIQPKESALAVAQMTLFIDSAQVASAKETSKDLLEDIADTIRRIKRIGAKNQDIGLWKNFDRLPIATFKFLCNQYKLKSKFEYGHFSARLIIGESHSHCLLFESENQEINLEEIETINQKDHE